MNMTTNYTISPDPAALPLPSAAASTAAAAAVPPPLPPMAPLSDFTHLAYDLLHGDDAKSLEALVVFRRQSSIVSNPPITTILQTPGVLEFMGNLVLNDLREKWVFEALWCLTNIASSTSDCTLAVARLPNMLQRLLYHAKHGSRDVKEQAVWCLGNIAGDGVLLRDMVNSLGAPAVLGEILLDDTNSLAILRNAAWTGSNLCRNKPFPAFDVSKDIVEAFVKRIVNDESPASRDEEVLVDVLWGLSYATDGNGAHDIFFQTGCIRKILEIIASSKVVTVITPALRCVGNVLSFTNAVRIDWLVYESDLLDTLQLLLIGAQKNGIVKEIAWTLSNVCAEPAAIVRYTVRHGILKYLFDKHASHYRSADVGKEVMYVLANSFSVEDKEVAKGICDQGCVKIMEMWVERQQEASGFIPVLEDAIFRFLKLGEVEGQDNQFASLFSKKAKNSIRSLMQGRGHASEFTKFFTPLPKSASQIAAVNEINSSSPKSKPKASRVKPKRNSKAKKEEDDEDEDKEEEEEEEEDEDEEGKEIVSSESEIESGSSSISNGRGRGRGRGRGGARGGTRSGARGGTRSGRGRVGGPGFAALQPEQKAIYMQSQASQFQGLLPPVTSSSFNSADVATDAKLKMRFFDDDKYGCEECLENLTPFFARYQNDLAILALLYQYHQLIIEQPSLRPAISSILLVASIENASSSTTMAADDSSNNNNANFKFMDELTSSLSALQLTLKETEASAKPPISTPLINNQHEFLQVSTNATSEDQKKTIEFALKASKDISQLKAAESSNSPSSSSSSSTTTTLDGKKINYEFKYAANNFLRVFQHPTPPVGRKSVIVLYDDDLFNISNILQTTEGLRRFRDDGFTVIIFAEVIVDSLRTDLDDSSSSIPIEIKKIEDRILNMIVQSSPQLTVHAIISIVCRGNVDGKIQEDHDGSQFRWPLTKTVQYFTNNINQGITPDTNNFFFMDSSNHPASMRFRGMAFNLQGKLISTDLLSSSVPFSPFTYNFISFTHPITSSANILAKVNDLVVPSSNINNNNGVVELVLAIGKPCSGLSTFISHRYPQHSIVERQSAYDTVTTPTTDTRFQLVSEILLKGKNCVVDDTQTLATKAGRDAYISYIKNHPSPHLGSKVKIIVDIFEISEKEHKHLQCLRDIVTSNVGNGIIQSKRVSEYSKFYQPILSTSDERIDEVNTNLCKIGSLPVSTVAANSYYPIPPNRVLIDTTFQQCLY